MPARYYEPWRDWFDTQVAMRLRAGTTILDIGGGRCPSVPLSQRPTGTTYIGLDPDAKELTAAPAGSYDQTFVSRAEQRIPDLVDSVDLAISWQVFEHVASLESVLQNVHSYLVPGGVLVSLFSGRWSAFAVINRLLPFSVGIPLVSRIARRDPEVDPVFPACYDMCYHTVLKRLMSNWSQVEIVPLYRGASYFGFSRPLMRGYLLYENAIRFAKWNNGATHYLLVATR